jgi:hypothetical protein
MFYQNSGIEKRKEIMIKKHPYLRVQLNLKKKYYENMENLIKPWQQIFQDEEKLKMFKIKLN